ncbi:hypothetical protein, partial [Enterobacter mori]
TPFCWFCVVGWFLFIRDSNNLPTKDDGDFINNTALGVSPFSFKKLKFLKMLSFFFCCSGADLC